MNAKPKLTLAVMMLAGFLGTAGIALPYPVLAPYFLDFPANELNHFMGIHPKVLLSVCLAIYPLGLFLGSMYMGAFSDIFGRKKVMTLSLLGAVLGYLLTAWSVWAESFLGFITARFLSGMCEGNISIARAIAVELGPVISKARGLSLMYSATYSGWLVGPILGGYLVSFGVTELFIFAAVGMLVALLLVVVVLQKDSTIEPEKVSWCRVAKEQNSFALLSNRAIWPVFGFYFLYTLGLNAFYEFYPVWFVDEFNASPKTIANNTVFLTAAMIVVSVVFVPKIQAVWGEVKAMLVGASLLAVLLWLQPFTDANHVRFIFVAIGCAIAIGNSMVPTFLSTAFGHLGQGKVMGLQTSIFCIANFLIALLGGALTIISSTYTLLLGAVLVASAVIWLWFNRRGQVLLLNGSG